jgi:hypothetical protein
LQRQSFGVNFYLMIEAPKRTDFAGRLRHALKLDQLPPTVRRLVVGLIGGTVLLIGVIMIVLPGPAVLILPVGLAVLATEFVWARRYMRKAKVIFRSAKSAVFGR